MTEKITAADAIRLLDAARLSPWMCASRTNTPWGTSRAKLLPLGQVIDRAAEVLPDKNALWLVYCRTGRRSADAVQKLEALGYTDLRDLGGIFEAGPTRSRATLRGIFKVIYFIKSKNATY